MSKPAFVILRELHRQLMLSPPKVRRAQARMLEELLLEFEADRVYPYEFVYFRITGFRPAEDRRDTYPGQVLLPELVALLDRLSRGVPREVAELGETVYTTSEAARTTGVSTRTLHRWRRRGLVSRRYRFPDGCVRVGVRRSALDRFMAQNAELAARSQSFSKLTHQEESRILRAARRLVEREDLGPSAAAQRVGGQMGRAPETVRQVIRRHDEDHPSEAIFTSARQAPKEAVQGRIFQDYRRGTPMAQLCQRYGRSRQSIYRIINAERAERLLAQPVRYVHDEAFDDPGISSGIFSEHVRALLEAPDQPARTLASRPSARWWESPLSEEDENALFRAYNYTKCLLAAQRRGLNPRRYAPTSLIRRIEDLSARADRLRDRLFRVHQALVEHVAWQHAGRRRASDALTAQGRAWLGELIESFDWRGPGRFASYATLELLKRFARRPPGGGASDEPVTGP